MPARSRSVACEAVIIGIDHVQVAAPAGCEAQARRFYGELLGLTEVEKPPALRARGGVWFACGAEQLHIGVSDRFTPATKAHPALLVRDPEALEQLARTLVAAGCEVRWDEDIPGARRFHVEDPWGNRVELVAR
jgi:catechol 2,3-dioxygenase-like lactoylglutathione lyase family enzyme